MGRRSARGTYWRTLLTGGASVAAVVVALSSPSAARQDPATAPQRIDTGAATGFAEVVTIAPSTGSLALALASGTVIAETSGGLAQAFSRTFDLGLIGSTLTGESCDGRDPVVTPEQLPQATQVDNRHGPASAETTEAPVVLPNLGVGLEQVTATLQPSSQAAVTSISAALDPLLRVDGGRAEATATVLEGAGREARSTSELAVEIAGVLRLTGMRWDAYHRTGPDPAATGEFAIGRIEALGVEVPFDSVDAAAAAINAALAPLGFTVELPRVERITEPVDLVRVTPFRISVDDSPLGAQLVRPALDITRTAREQLFNSIYAASCSAGGALLIGEIGVGILSGTGSLVVSLGGAEARSGEIVEEDPFAHDVAFTPPAPPPDVSAELTVPSFSAPGGALPPSAVPAATPAAERAVDPIVTETRCESTHPLASTACSHGSAAAVGLIGAAATGAVALLDLRSRRRSRPAAVAS